MDQDTLYKLDYRRFNPGAFESESVTDCYQKAFRDENDDRKYFLTWRKWDFSKYATVDNNLEEPAYDAYTQLTTKDGDVINIEFLSGWEPQKAEEFLDKLFETGWFRKYDDRDLY